MTLLVLDVKLPGDTFFASDAALMHRLLSVEHTFVIYFISFVVLGMFWVRHHAQFHFVRYVDHTLLWINLIFLFGITSVPFSTDLLGDHHHLRLPYWIYGIKLMLLAGLMAIQVVYLRRHPELAHPSLTGGRCAADHRAHRHVRGDPAALDGGRALQYPSRPVPLLPARGRSFHARTRVRAPSCRRRLTAPSPP